MMARMKSTGARAGSGTGVSWSSGVMLRVILCVRAVTTALGLPLPAIRNPASFFARHPHDHRLRAGRSGLVSNFIGWFDEPRHPRLQDLADAVDHVFQLSRLDVKNLDRPVRVLARI